MRIPRVIPYRTAWWSDAKELHAWMSNYQFTFRAFAWFHVAFAVGYNLIASEPMREGAELRRAHQLE